MPNYSSDIIYKNLIDKCPDGVIVSRGNQVVLLNETSLDFLGIADVSDIADRSFEDFIHPDDRQRTRQRLQTEIAEEGQSIAGVLRLLRADGSTRTAHVRATPIEHLGEPAILTICRDVTEAAEERRQRHANLERLSSALEASEDGAWDWDIINDTVIYNKAWTDMLGLAPITTTQTPRTWTALVHPADLASALDVTQRHLRGESKVLSREIRLKHADGHYVWVLDRGKVIDRAEDGSPRRMVGTHRDISDRKKAEIALDVRSRITETILTSSRQEMFMNVMPLVSEALDSPTALLCIVAADQCVSLVVHDRGKVWRTDPEKGQIDASGLAVVLENTHIANQKSDLIDCPLDPFFETRLCPVLVVPVRIKGQALGFLKVANRNIPYSTADEGTLLSLANYLAPILRFQFDNIEKEEQLRQSQKQEAIGALAGGIAHDFNNILQAILGFSNLALAEADTLESGRAQHITEDLQRVVLAANRGKDLINRILLFSRQQASEHHILDLTSVFQETVGLLTSTIPATITIQTSTDSHEYRVMADSTQLCQVLLNLATNAVHAMHGNEGVLTFHHRLILADDNETQVPESLTGLNLAEITVKDTGQGMDQVTLKRLFDPFFTTKPVGQGTGLGLSVAHGIIKNHRGEIRFESQPGEGTTVYIYLPILPDFDL